MIMIVIIMILILTIIIIILIQLTSIIIIIGIGGAPAQPLVDAADVEDVLASGARRNLIVHYSKA